MNQIDSGRFTRETLRDWDAELDNHPDRGAQLDDVPLRLTEERIRAETDRIGNVEPIERSPKAASAVGVAEPPVSPSAPETAPISGREPPSGPAAAAGEIPLRAANQSDRSGSILGLDSALRQHPPTAAPANRIEPRSGVGTDIKEKKNSRRSRVPWGVVVALVVMLAAESGYACLAIRRNSVNVSQLPGAAVLRGLGAEIESARSKLQQSGVSADLNALGQEAAATLNTAYRHARRLAGEVRDRYNQRHGR